MRPWLPLLLGALLTTLVSHSALGKTPLRACADDAQWPPFSYQQDDGTMAGFTVALLEQVFAATDLDLEVQPLPWKRCLALTESGAYQIAVDASASPERRRAFRLSEAYYRLTPYYFYSLRQFPEGLAISRGSELERAGSVCGLPGYNYSNFALGDIAVESGAGDFYALATMAHRGRCAVFIGRYEIVAGMAHVGSDLLADPELGYAAIPDAEPEPFYLLISRNIDNGEALKEIFDRTLAELRRSGELQRLRQAYR